MAGRQTPTQLILTRQLAGSLCCVGINSITQASPACPERGMGKCVGPGSSGVSRRPGRAHPCSAPQPAGTQWESSLLPPAWLLPGHCLTAYHGGALPSFSRSFLEGHEVDSPVWLIKADWWYEASTDNQSRGSSCPFLCVPARGTGWPAALHQIQNDRNFIRGMCVRGWWSV